MSAAEELLLEYFGHTAFRTGQKLAIDALTHGQDVLAVMPTGAGKSICYQIPALLMEGMAIVISPLISLMKDQVESLRLAGIPAAFLNSSISSEDYFSTVDDVAAGAVKILYVAPERLLTEGFVRLIRRVRVSMVAVDEAHCVSQWGQDFRPGYLDILRFIQLLPQRPVTAAFTATATKQVSEDIERLLGLRMPVRITTGFDRPNLFFGVRSPEKKYPELVSLLRQYTGRSGIIYCATRKNVEEVCEKLQKDGFSAGRYHAGLSDEERAKNQDDFLYDRTPVIVATNAFGMGIDKSNVSFVIHYNMPGDMESYYQEAGRAGRDGTPADCILLYNAGDVRLQEFFIENSRETMTADPAQQNLLIRRNRERLALMQRYAVDGLCLRHKLLSYFGEKSPAQCGNCSCCRANYQPQDDTVNAQKVISCVYRGQKAGYHLSRSQTADILLGSRQKKLLDMRLDRLSTYGIMSKSSARELREFIDYLIADGELALQLFDRCAKPYQELVLTRQAAQVLRGEKKVIRMIPNHVAEEKRDAADLTEEQRQLFERLRGLRRRIAEAEKRPPYFIFSDATLREMCRKRPENPAQMRSISGVGTMRAQKYGRDFLEEINRI